VATDEQQQAADRAIDNAKHKRFWDSRKFWFGMATIASWTYLYDRMLTLGIGAGAKSLEIPQELWWAMVIKGALEALIFGGVAALDAYATKLPFSAMINGVTGQVTPPKREPEESPPAPKAPSSTEP